MFSRFITTLLLILSLLSTLTTAFASESLEYQLATINASGYVSKDHITVARFRSLLNQLSVTFVEDKQQIADMSVSAQNLLKKEGIQESLINIMEGMNQLFSIKIENQKYAEYTAGYVTLRGQGQSHAVAIDSLQEFLRTFGVR
jgi:hypothetical protein